MDKAGIRMNRKLCAAGLEKGQKNTKYVASSGKQQHCGGLLEIKISQLKKGESVRRIALDTLYR